MSSHLSSTMVASDAKSDAKLQKTFDFCNRKEGMKAHF
jgi:hypothetical protein